LKFRWVYITLKNSKPLDLFGILRDALASLINSFSQGVRMDNEEARLQKYNEANRLRGLLEELANGIEDSSIFPFGLNNEWTIEEIHERLLEIMEANKE
jgi:hypothetical protein